MTKVYYFSGTGNTLWSAKRLAELLAPCEIFNIAAEMRRESITIEADAVIVLFPAYAYQTPSMVRRFLVRAEIHASYIAALTTFGSDPGGALAEASRILKRKKTPLSFAGGIPCVENYITIFGVPSSATKEKRLAMQRTATENMARMIGERKTSRVVLTFRPFSTLVSSLFRVAKRLFVKGYKVADRCNGCALCARICPAGAVIIIENKPVFSSACEHCQACLNWCPMRAIRYIRISPDSERYHHPEVKAADMLIRGGD
ncbi:MAG: EFR1 family ferrodoxin [Treponema sp.]|jgi:ferredoxin/protein involved in ribonucleotide reduction|nr:EFR1 family ferrodoxin [Treponema sp.]